MNSDHLRDLGLVSLGSRMRRLGERLQTQAQPLLAQAGIDAPAAQLPLLDALAARGAMTVGALATALGVAQPGVTRLVARLEDEGLVAVRAGAKDARQRVVALSPKGRRLIAKARRDAWPLVETALRDACAGLSGSLIDQLGALEDALAAAPLVQRQKETRHARRASA